MSSFPIHLLLSLGDLTPGLLLHRKTLNGKPDQARHVRNEVYALPDTRDKLARV